MLISMLHTEVVEVPPDCQDGQQAHESESQPWEIIKYLQTQKKISVALILWKKNFI